MTPKAQAARAKTDKWNYIKLTSSVQQKKQEFRRQPTKWKTFSNAISDKGSITKIYKEFIELNIKKTINQFKTEQKLK